MKKQKTKVLIFYVTAGGGHKSAARNIQKAYAIAGGETEVLCVDLLDYTNRLYKWLKSEGYLHLASRWPFLFGLGYDKTDRPWQIRLPLPWDLLNAGPVLRLIRSFRPDMIIATHALPAQLVSRWKGKGYISTPLAVVGTDFDIHANWFCRHYEQYFVPVEETRQYLQHYGIDPSKITVSGIPINPDFRLVKDKAALQAKYGLQPDLPTLLLTGGGYGLGPVEELLGNLMQLQHSAQIIVMCGNNESLKGRIENLKTRDHLSLKAVGFTEHMDEWMALSDIGIGKAGGLTSWELLAKGVPQLLVNPIPGQEIRNTRHLVQAGAALWCNNLEVLAWTVDNLLDGGLSEMQRKALLLARPRAALDIVERLDSLLIKAA